MTELSLLGGEPVRTEDLPVGYDPTARDNFGDEEVQAVTEVLESGRLSGFKASSGEEFYGGEKVRELEKEWADYFDVENAVSVNSWTSGLFAAVGAANLSPGAEVIVPPLTMSASATAVLGNNAVPVFADVKKTTANLDPQAVQECITNRTEAIMIVHLFGYPAEMDELLTIADEHDLIVIEDAAQAIGAKYDGEYVGTIGDIGGFSLNVHKHIHAGEGGIITTEDNELAQRTRLIRNHAESVIGDLEESYLGDLEFNASDMTGQNYRMTELTAAVANEQLKKLPDLLERRIARAKELRSLLNGVDIVDVPPVRKKSTHSYYGFPLWYDPDVGNVSIEVFIEALNAEGVPAMQYVEPLYNLPIYQEKNVHSNGIVHDDSVAGGTPIEYPANQCPVAEHLYNDRVIWTDTVLPDSSSDDLQDIARTLKKIEENRQELRQYAEENGGPLQ